MTTTIVIIFVAFTLFVHFLLACSIFDEARKLGLNRTRWTLFILIGGIPALLVYRAERRHALRQLAEDNASPTIRAQTERSRQRNIEYLNLCRVGIKKENDMVLRRIGPLSAAKISGVLYVVIGFIAGIFMAMMSLFMPTPEETGFALNLFFGFGALVFMPIFYGVMGFLAGLVGAAIYNLVAGVIGGLEMDFEEPGG